jgi:hypothetical protein
MKGREHMLTVKEQAKQWATDALKFDVQTTAQIHASIDSIPLSMTGMPYCPACESVLCGACGHCHMLDVVPFTRPECPLDNDDMGHDCMVWFQAYKAIHTVQHMEE